ncbi:terpene synthase family protein [Kitasatospora aureofaciens]|uniref:terpene synthase family protein n=1 Tax=Kitasatospora aureofaciens TaxID=1894 RepID=UPI0037F8E461
MLTFSKYSAWSFQLDDLIDFGRLGKRAADVAAVVMPLCRIIEASDAHLLGDLPLAIAWADIAREIHSWATPVQLTRFSRSFREWMGGFVWEAALREQGIIPDLNTYLALRVLSAGSANGVAMAEMIAGLELPATVWADRPVIAAREAAMAVAVLDNDRYSRARAVRDGEESFDVYDIVLRHHPQASFTEGLRTVVALRDRIMALYLRLSAQLRRRADTQLDAEAIPHETPTLVLKLLDVGLSPYDAVTGLVRHAMKVADGVLPDPAAFREQLDEAEEMIADYADDGSEKTDVVLTGIRLTPPGPAPPRPRPPRRPPHRHPRLLAPPRRVHRTRRRGRGTGRRGGAGRRGGGRTAPAPQPRAVRRDRPHRRRTEPGPTHLTTASPAADDAGARTGRRAGTGPVHHLDEQRPMALPRLVEDISVTCEVLERVACRIVRALVVDHVVEAPGPRPRSLRGLSARSSG